MDKTKQKKETLERVSLVVGRGIEPLLQDWESWVLTVIRTDRFIVWDCKGSAFSLQSKFFCNFFQNLFQKHEKYRHNQAKEGCKMVPLERLTFEHHSYKHCEDSEWYHFLNDLELHQIERTAVLYISDSVCRYLSAVLKKCHSPWEEDYQDKRPACGNLHFLKLQVAVPCKCHEYIGCYKQKYCPDCLHRCFCFGLQK